MSTRNRIEAYWEDPNTVSLVDQNLRKLETDFVLSQLSSSDNFADFGCGSGESTVHYAKIVKTCFALEQSNTLRKKASQRFQESQLQNITLVEGDVTNLSAYKEKFNVALTQRVVINFMTWKEQKEVLMNIWDSLRPGGRYIMLENTFEGFENLNTLRREVHLPNIPLHDWHNYFLHYGEFIKYIEGKFIIEKIHTFNLYYLLTRVFINMFAKFEGYGANIKKDHIFDLADKAAYDLYKVFGDKVKIDCSKGNSFGPIQGFVLRKMS